MIVAIPLFALWCGAATSQTSTSASQVENRQYQDGDVLASGTLDVTDSSDSVVGVTTALANGVSVGVDTNLMNVNSRQVMTGTTRADASLYMNTGYPASAVMNTEAAANAATSTATNGSADGYYVQQSLGPLIHAGTGVYGATAGADYLSASTQGIGNTIGIGADNARNDAVIHQTNNAAVEGASGGSIGYIANSISFAGTAISNNVTASGVNGSAMNIDAHQTSSGDHIQGTSFLSAGNVQSISGAATATANNMSVNNQGGPLVVKANQVNNSYIRAESVVSPSLFGSATAVAYGVGNSVLAGEYGDSLSLDNTQENTGSRIDAIAGANGGDGYDLNAQATAMGNAVTGYACSECGGVINVNNDQRNASGVHATTTVTTTGTNRSTQAITTAVGNSATFYVTKPGG